MQSYTWKRIKARAVQTKERRRGKRKDRCKKKPETRNRDQTNERPGIRNTFPPILLLSTPRSKYKTRMVFAALVRRLSKREKSEAYPGDACRSQTEPNPREYGLVEAVVFYHRHWILCRGGLHVPGGQRFGHCELCGDVSRFQIGPSPKECGLVEAMVFYRRHWTLCRGGFHAPGSRTFGCCESRGRCFGREHPGSGPAPGG